MSKNMSNGIKNASQHSLFAARRPFVGSSDAEALNI
jgi:hypothetical protein